MRAYANVARKNFDSTFTANNWFSDRTFYTIIAGADIGSIKSLHTLFVKHLNHILVNSKQICTVQTIHNFELFDKNY